MPFEKNKQKKTDLSPHMQTKERNMVRVYMSTIYLISMSKFRLIAVNSLHSNLITCLKPPRKKAVGRGNFSYVNVEKMKANKRDILNVILLHKQ